MRRAKRDVEAALLSKGFRERQGDHAYFIYHDLDGRKSLVKTKTSHGRSSKELGADLIGLMARQCRLTTKQFLELVDCPMSREDYEEHLRREGLV